MSEKLRAQTDPGIPTDILIKTIGYVEAQNKSLDLIASNYSELKPEVQRVRLAFSSNYGKGYNALKKDVYSKLSKAIPKFKDSLNNLLDQRLGGLVFTKDQAKSFIDTVGSRASGKLSNPYKQILLAYKYRLEPHMELRDGFAKRYCYDLSGQDVSFCISIPESWVEKKALRPNIIAKYFRGAGYGADQFIIQGLSLPSEQTDGGYSEDEIAEAFKRPEVMREYLPEDAVLIRTSTIKIDGQLGVYAEYKLLRQKLKHEFEIKMSSYFIFYSSYLISFTGFIAAVENIPEIDTAGLDKRHDRLKSLFDLIANSVVFPQKWE